MIRSMLLSAMALAGWPRTSGDDPNAPILPGNDWKLAPHERG